MEHLTRDGESKIVAALHLSADRHSAASTASTPTSPSSTSRRRACACIDIVPGLDSRRTRSASPALPLRHGRRAEGGPTCPKPYICDAIRTPIGRYGGALVHGAPRRSRRAPLAGPAGAQPGRRLGRGRRRDLRLRQPGRRGQPQRRAAWRCCSPACRRRFRARRSTACADRAWTRSAPPRARSGAARPTWSSPAASRA